MKRLSIAFFVLSVAIMAVVVTQPVDMRTHVIASLAVLLALALLKALPRRGVLRALACALGAAMVLRYLWWRTTETLPPLSDPTDFAAGVMLYGAEVYFITTLVLAIFVVADPTRRAPRTLNREVEAPTVDILVPSINEDEALVATTLAAARQLDYPGDRLNVYLLDDGGTDERVTSNDPAVAEAAQRRRARLRAIAADLGVRYLTRTDNLSAKAGNLNHGLANSSGEFVAVFDADHAPARDFLQATLPHFADDRRLFLVQTPHFFTNPDPVELSLGTWDRMPSENELFFGNIQQGLDRWNACLFCGSAAVLRRSALDEAGGFLTATVTEDAETALELHAAGWNSVYVDRPMVAGLQPGAYSNFIGQRRRWCEGMLQIFTFRNPLFKRGLNMPQRLGYLSLLLYWLFPFARLMLIAAPLLYLYFGLQIFDASGTEFAAFALPYVAVNMLLQNYLWGTLRWPLISELYETLQSVHLIKAVGAVVRPRRARFRVTPKDEVDREAGISGFGVPICVLFALLAGGVVATLWRIAATPEAVDTVLVVGGWNLLNLLVVGAALGVVAERPTPRTAQRVPVDRPAEIVHGDRVIPARMDDVSVDGARVVVPANVMRQIKPGEATVLRFEPLASLDGGELPVTVRSVVRDDDGAALECDFSIATTHHHRLIADLVFANSDEWVRFQARRRRETSLVRGLVEFAAMALFQTGRGLRALLATRSRVRPAPAPVLRPGDEWS